MLDGILKTYLGAMPRLPCRRMRAHGFSGISCRPATCMISSDPSFLIWKESKWISLLMPEGVGLQHLGIVMIAY
jgi:hypothetical protein